MSEKEKETILIFEIIPIFKQIVETFESIYLGDFGFSSVEMLEEKIKKLKGDK